MALAHAILVALLDRPCSGYDLAKRFSNSVGFFWDASHQQIYRELSKLEAQNYLTSEKVLQDTRPNKKLYAVTEAGKLFLKDWMAEPTALNPVKDDLLVKIFGGYLVPVEIIVSDLLTHRQQHQARLDEYRTIEKQFFPERERLSPVARFQYLTLRNGIRYEQSWLAWCEEAIAYLQPSKLQNSK
ncbi:PadR family transcriptional regulator [Almyronema epifaneia]|uniref:PadR family transcriptional regulator n=1 Tax=Almyronema epifaneia S1 TaxID=2991925 RepID=A0ABW6IJ70_9CYAN